MWNNKEIYLYPEIRVELACQRLQSSTVETVLTPYSNRMGSMELTSQVGTRFHTNLRLGGSRIHP